MTLRTAIVAASLVVVAPAVWAQSGVVPKGSDTFSIYQEFDNWTIYEDHDRKSCLAEAVDSNGTVVQMGLTENHDLGYFGVFTQMDLATDGAPAEVPLTITVNGNVYSGTGHSVTQKLSNGYHGGYIPANNPKFLSDIENGQTMIAFSDLGEGIAVGLAGTKQAIEAAKACTMKLGG